MSKNDDKSYMLSLCKILILSSILAALTACGNGGKINFFDSSSTASNSPAGFNMVPGSKALVIESGKTTTNGYHAKIEYNTLKGQTFTAAGGYSARLDFTSRH